MTVYYNVLKHSWGPYVKPVSNYFFSWFFRKWTCRWIGNESVKTYLVTVFAIDGSRIATKGQNKPNIPSLQAGGTLELELLNEGDRRVSIESIY
jgi:hypothetical protein